MQTQEAIKKYLLKKKNVTKLDIFLFLSEHRFFITTHYLADYFDMSDSNLLLYIQELEQDFTTLEFEEIAIVKQKNFIKLACEEIDIAKCYYGLLGKYCSESTNYQILTALLSENGNTMTSLSQQTNYSPSYLYSKMKTVNQFLALYGISFKFSNKGRKILSGTEVQIQYCFLDVYWNIFANTSFPYSNEPEQTIAYTLNAYFKKDLLIALNGGMIDKLYLLLKICQENFPATTLKNVQKEFTEHGYIEYLVDPVFDLLHPNLPIGYEQRILINVLARLAISKIESDELSQYQYELLLKAKVPHIMYCKKMVEAFATHFSLNIPRDQQALYTMNFARNKIFSTFLNHDQPNTPLPTFVLYQGKKNFTVLQNEIERFYLQFREEHHHYLPEILDRENVQWIVEGLLHLYDRFKAQPTIVIGINYTKDFYVGKDLLVKIEQIFSSDSIIIQKYYMEECDIIVSDSPLDHLSKDIKKIYLLDGIVSPNDWKRVVTKIAEYIFELKQENDYSICP